MRIALLDTYYPRFLAACYFARPELARDGYQIQLRHLIDQVFGTSDFYSRHLQSLGHDAQDLIGNCTQLQRTWALEHRVEYSALALKLPQRLQRLPWNR
jgi:spore maturation protein CgeB